VQINTKFNAVLQENPASGVYSATAFDAGTLHDLSGHGRDATVTAGIVSLRTASGHGTSANVVALAGSLRAKMLWPVGSIPATFTVCSVTRYDDLGGSRGRILTCGESPDQPLDWIHGHNYGNRGIVYYGGVDGYQTGWTNVGTDTDWLVMCGTNDVSVAAPGNVILDQVGSPSEPTLSPAWHVRSHVVCLSHLVDGGEMQSAANVREAAGNEHRSVRCFWSQGHADMI